MTCDNGKPTYKHLSHAALLNHQRNSTFPHEQVTTLDLPHTRSSLPNRFAYRMILKEHGKLNLQVLELIEKGYIQEITILYAVPTL